MLIDFLYFAVVILLAAIVVVSIKMQHQTIDDYLQSPERLPKIIIALSLIVIIASAYLAFKADKELSQMCDVMIIVLSLMQITNQVFTIRSRNTYIMRYKQFNSPT